jgi:hypothetical protein
MAPKIICGDPWRKMSHRWATILQRSWWRSPAARFQWLVLLLVPVWLRTGGREGLAEEGTILVAHLKSAGRELQT